MVHAAARVRLARRVVVTFPVGLVVARQAQNRPTSAALARVDWTPRAGIITETSGTKRSPILSSIRARGAPVTLAGTPGAPTPLRSPLGAESPFGASGPG